MMMHKSKIGPSPGGGIRKRSPKIKPSNPSVKMKVCIRARPCNERETTANARSVLKYLDRHMLIFDPKQCDEPFFFHGVKQNLRDITKKQNKNMKMLFDRVYDGSSTNEDVFEGSIKSILPSLLDGYNCSVFVYGATGAGKTYTMLGNEETPGVTYLTMMDLYTLIEGIKETKDVKIRISYLEVYNENIHDLLNPASGPLHLREDPSVGVFVNGITLEHISCAEHLFELLRRGNTNRTQHPTDANEESSRSHAVFQVYLKIQDLKDEQTQLVKLSMIDLAGSERGAATHCTGMRFKEGSNINKSLLALGNCINNLADGVRHIPYRDSKLTRLLKDSLGGNCQTVMIACVGPTTISYEDTYNTLKYALRARTIKTTLTKSVTTSDTQAEYLMQTIGDLRQQIDKLRKELAESKKAGIGGGGDADKEMAEWLEKLEKVYQEKRRLHKKILSLESEELTLKWRIKCKRKVCERLQKVDSAGAAEKFKVKTLKSVARLECRISALRMERSDVWDAKMGNEAALVEAMAGAEAFVAGNALLSALLASVRCSWEEKLKRLEEEQCKEHVVKLLSQYAVLSENQGDALDVMVDSQHGYTKQYSILKGYDKVTTDMKRDYETTIKKLKGVCRVNFDFSPTKDTAHRVAELKGFGHLSTEALRACSKPNLVLPAARILQQQQQPPKRDGTFIIGNDDDNKGAEISPPRDATFVKNASGGVPDEEEGEDGGDDATFTKDDDDNDDNQNGKENGDSGGCGGAEVEVTTSPLMVLTPNIQRSNRVHKKGTPVKKIVALGKRNNKENMAGN